MSQLPDFDKSFSRSQGWDEVCFTAKLMLNGPISQWIERYSGSEKISIHGKNILTEEYELLFSKGESTAVASVIEVIDQNQKIAKISFYGDCQQAQQQQLVDQIQLSLLWLRNLQLQLISAQVFTQAPVIMYQAAEVNGRWILTDANQALADFLGVSAKALIGARAKQTMVDFIHPDDIPTLMKTYDLTRSTAGQLTLQYRLKNNKQEYIPVTERVSYSPDQINRRCVSVIWHREIDQLSSGQQFQLFQQIEKVSQDLSFESGTKFLEQFSLRFCQSEEITSTLLLAHTHGHWWQAYAVISDEQVLPVFQIQLPADFNVTEVSWGAQQLGSLPGDIADLLFPQAVYQSVLPLRHDDENTQALLLIGSHQKIENSDYLTQLIRLFGIRLLREIEQLRIAAAQDEQYQLLIRQKHQLTQMISLLGQLDTASDQQQFLLICQQHLSKAFGVRAITWRYWTSGDWLEIKSLNDYRENKWFQQVEIVQNDDCLGAMDRCRRLGELTYAREQLKTFWPMGNSAAGYLVGVLSFKTQIPDDELIQFSQNALSLAQQGLMQRENLHYQAMRDSLTGLGNRVQLHAWMKSNLPRIDQASLLLFDLNRFKEINDSFGHQFGDKLLQEIGPRIARYLQDHEHYLSRLGGDEFALFLPSIDRDEAFELGRRLHKKLAENYIIDGLRFQVEASVGVAHFPEHGKDGHELLRCSDVAMYAAKNSNRNVVAFNPALDNTTPLRIAVLSGLDEAFVDNQLWVAYQPLMSTKTGQVAGFEALIRWTHPKFGPLSPGEFIPIAEMGEGIRKLTYFVLRQTMANIVQWRKQAPALHVAVNVSPRVLLDHQFPITLKDMLKEFKLPGEAIILELTESTLLVDPIRAVEIINVLAQMGIKVEIDDFGTGYSSLAYLKSLPISALKIDRSFVTDILVDSQNEVIVSSTVQMAHNLGLLTVAEGVEDEATLQKMMRLGCDLIQGYYFAKPIAGDMVSAWLDRNL